MSGAIRTLFYGPYVYAALSLVRVVARRAALRDAQLRPAALRELGLPTGEVPLALFAFNVGIELGQLAVIGAAFLLVGWARHQPWYRPRVAMPLSVTIAVIGFGWAVERLLG